MRYFFLDENDRNKMDGRPDFIMSPVLLGDESQSGAEDDLYQCEYIAVSSSERTFFGRLEGYITAPVLYKSERYLGFFSEEAWEKVLDDIKHLPWERTVSAYNMKTPKITIAAEDLRDAEVMDNLKKCRLIGLYCFTPLDSYGFIAEFPTLRDLFIRHGDNICSLSFARGLFELTMIYLKNACLDDLQSLIDNFNEKRELAYMPRAICIGFYHCSVADTSALQKAEFITSELLAWPIEGDIRERWRMRGYPRPGTFKFYEQKKETIL